MVQVVLGDIAHLAFSVDGIVNAANAALIPGGGVDGALNHSAGPKLKQAMANIGGTPTGTAVITPAFDLAATYVIHAVGPRYVDGSHGEKEQLIAAYEAVFRLAHAYHLSSLAVPILSAGIYQYPMEEAAQVLYDVATRIENQDIATTIVVFESFWLEVFKKIR